MSNLRSSQLLEETVFLPLTRRQQQLVAQLDFFRRWYLLCHAAYIMALTLLASIVFYTLERDVLFIDAFFTAISTMTNCGLKTVDVARWNAWSTLARHIFIPFGGCVVTSSFQPLSRLVMLYRVRDVFVPTYTDNAAQRRLRCVKSQLFSRLFRTSIICAITPILYTFFVCTSGVTVTLLFNVSGLGLIDSMYLVLSAFHGCIFLSMERYATDAVVVGVTLVTSALGFTAFPVMLRSVFAFEKLVMQACLDIYKLTQPVFAEERTAMLTSSVTSSIIIADANEDNVNDAVCSWLNERSSLARERPSTERGFELSTLPLSPTNVWIHAFRDILSAAHPSTFHAFLFTKHETIYLAVAWILITLAQFVPFLYHPWPDTLRDCSYIYMLFLFFCQAGVARFAAASFISIDHYRASHIVLTLLAMFLPPLPISTDRTYRKWKEMFRTSIVRLLTSRLFWLFVAFFSIVASEEQSDDPPLADRRFDIVTCTLFEVISAYAGCGLSLSLPGSTVSFIGSCGCLSKAILAAVLFSGRHRFVDLGIDLGFAELRNNMTHDEDVQLDQSDVRE